MGNNMVRARVTISGTRPLLQHEFGPHAIPLEKAERTGVAGNDPTEWKRSCMVNEDGWLFIRDIYVFGCLRDGASYTKKGRGSIQKLLAATLQVEEPIILLDRRLPPNKPEPPLNDRAAPVYVSVDGVRNPTTKARNVRYRLAASRGWKLTFTLVWDRTIVSREQMQAVLRDAGTLVGIGDGRSVGNGRFAVLSYEELSNAEEAPATGSLELPSGDRLAKGRKKVRPLLDGAEA